MQGGRLSDQIGIIDAGRVDRNLVGAGIQKATDIGNFAHAAANGKRNKHLPGHGFDHGQYDVALITRSRDVEKGQFVCSLFVVATSNLHRIARVA